MNDQVSEPASAEVIEEGTPVSDPPTDEQKKECKPRPTRWPWFALAFIAGTAASFFILTKMPQVLHLPIEPTPIIQVSQESMVTPEPIAQTPPPVVESITEPVSIDNNLAISSAEGEALIAAINELHQTIEGMNDELQVLRDKQGQVRITQTNIESMQLHSRLGWIINPSSHLPQIQLAWQEIVLLPSLNANQRQEAETMFKLAQQRMEDIHQWQQELDHLSSSFSLNESANIIPDSLSETPNLWLQWVAQQFSLKHSQTREELELTELKNTLARINHAMDLEQWPEGTEWTQLRSELQLRIIQQVPPNEEVIVLQLPEKFNAIQADIIKLRQTAQQWLEEQ